MSKKVCPLTFHVSRDIAQLVGEECLQENCGWWDEDNDSCAMLGIVRELNQLDLAIQLIPSNMDQ